MTTAIQALWSIQLQMEAYLPRGLCVRARVLARSRASWTRRMDDIHQRRAEKQRRLGLGAGAVEVGSGAKAGVRAQVGVQGGAGGSEREQEQGQGAGVVEDVMSAAEWVGTLLVRVDQLHGVDRRGGILSLAPDAVATLTLEESHASVEEVETVRTRVATFDGDRQRCRWGETFRFQVQHS
ncbi:unnamed protein product, partial [Discosporangium mesarthrocarpum]